MQTLVQSGVECEGWFYLNSCSHLAISAIKGCLETNTFPLKAESNRTMNTRLIVSLLLLTEADMTNS